MKKILLVGVIALVGAVSHAQTIIPKVGATMSMFTGDVESDVKAGFTIGAALNMPLGNGKFSFQPELNFIQKGTKNEFRFVDGPNVSDITEGTQKVTINYLEVPVLIKATFGSFHLNVGPSVGFGLGGKYKIETADGEFESDVKFGNEPDDETNLDYYIKESTDINLQFGFGWTIAKTVLLDFRSGFGLTNFDQREDYTTKNLVLQFAVGVPISIGGK
jgi:hypothetical protein